LVIDKTALFFMPEIDGCSFSSVFGQQPKNPAAPKEAFAADPVRLALHQVIHAAIVAQASSL